MKIRRVKLGESDATEYTYDNGEVWTIVDNPMFDGSAVAEGPKQTVKWEIFDLGAEAPRTLDSDKLIEMYKEAKEEILQTAPKPVKFMVCRTSIPFNREPSLELFPGTLEEEEPVCYGDALTEPRSIRTIEFTTAEEIVNYMRAIKNPIVIESSWDKCNPYPRLEIYDDYRE